MIGVVILGFEALVIKCRGRALLKYGDDFDNVGNEPFSGLVQENKMATWKTETIFENMVKFVLRQYLPFNKACPRHVEFELRYHLSLELRHAIQFFDTPRSVTSQ